MHPVKNRAYAECTVAVAFIKLLLPFFLNQSITSAMARAKCYHTMDAFVKLVVVLVRYSGDASNTITKVNLLNKVCCDADYIIVRCVST